MTSKKFIISLIIGIFVIVGLVYYYFFTGMLSGEEKQYVYVDADDDIDSVYNKLEPISSLHGITAFKTIARHTSYGDHIFTGRYEIEPKNGAYSVYKKLKNGLQSSLMVTVPSVRTLDRLAGAVSKHLMMDSLTLYQAITDSAKCAKYGYTIETMPCLFIPETYEMYWNVSADRFLEKMAAASKAFWTDERKKKALDMGLSPEEVITLASIVDEETAQDKEKPMVAGLYYNRLRRGMLLQADPTVKYAMKDFGLRRIYYNMLSVDSPYNTYRYPGLPPGPIRIPSIAGIDAVLNYVDHDYLYMCAKEDFSGTHNFAKTLSEHTANAKKYSQALNERNIR
ncbi:MAG: endolytic transglycosylase MltG [Prevotella sp.]|nr:endolytic transglycosylase MltG [Prevotella sp.]